MNQSINSSQMVANGLRWTFLAFYLIPCLNWPSTLLGGPIFSAGHRLGPLAYGDWQSGPIVAQLTTSSVASHATEGNGNDFNAIGSGGNEISSQQEAVAAYDDYDEDESLVGLLAKAIQDPSSVSSGAPATTTTATSTTQPSSVSKQRAQIDKLFADVLNWSGEFEEYLGRRMRETWRQFRGLFPPSAGTGANDGGRQPE